MSADAATLPWRVDTLEREHERVADRVSTLWDDSTKSASEIAALQVSVGKLDKGVGELKDSLNRVFWALITFALTVAGSAVALVLTQAGS